MAVFLGKNIDRSSDFSRLTSRWLTASPVLFHTTYPIILDIAQDLKFRCSNPLTQELCETLAPDWTMFEHLDLYGLATNLEGDAVFVAETEAEEAALSSSVAMVTRSLQNDTGVLFRNPHRYDVSSIRFCRRVIHEASISNFHVAIDGPVGLRKHGPYADLLKDSLCVHTERMPVLTSPNKSALALVAICDHGLPLQVLKDMGVSWPDDPGYTVLGPAGHLWAICDRSMASAARGKLSNEQKARLHRDIFDHWPCSDWGYLRRRHHAIESGDHYSAIMTHYPFLHAMPWISRDFTYQHLVSLMSLLERSETDRILALHCLIGAAKLAPYVSIADGFTKAIQYWMDALELATEPETRVRLMVQLANIYAVQRNTESLWVARRWHLRAFEELSSVKDARMKVETRIQLLNGLALVEYHSHNDRRALDLELRAKRSAQSIAGLYPDISEWAIRLINSNTAKLADRRLFHSPFALHCLRENMKLRDRSSSGRAVIELASFHFDRSDYHATLQVLTPILEGGELLSMSEKNALLCRFIWTVSSFKIGNYVDVKTVLPILIKECRRQSAIQACALLENVGRELSEVAE